MKNESEDAALLGYPSAAECSFTLMLPERSNFIRVKDIAQQTARAIHPCDEDKPSLGYLQTVLAHVESVDLDARAGFLRLLDPITFKVQSYETARQTVGRGQQCLVSWTDFVKFAQRLGIEVAVSDVAAVVADPAIQIAEVEPNLAVPVEFCARTTPPIKTVRQRSDALAPVIDDVVANLESRGKTATPADVMTGLKALKGGNTCVTDIAEDGALIWTGANGKEKLTMSALKGRLQRLKKLRATLSPDGTVKER